MTGASHSSKDIGCRASVGTFRRVPRVTRSADAPLDAPTLCTRYSTATWLGLDPIKIEKNASVAVIKDTCIQEWIGQGPSSGGPDQTKPDQGH